MKIYFIFCFCLFFSCQPRKQVDSASYFREKLYDKKLMDSLDNRVLNNGDTLAYLDLRVMHYIGQQRPTGFLYYALIMSNKYNYKTASYDVFDIIMYDSTVLDCKTKEMANAYLIKSK